LSLNNVDLAYGSDDGRVLTLSNICLNVPRGGFVSLVGASGSGKTSVLNLISGLVEPSSGEIRISGETTLVAREKRKIGFVFQQPVLFGWRNVTENVKLPGEIMHRPDVTARAQDLIKLVDLEGYENHYPHELSGGMQSRVAIARALAHQPDLLLMDEPFADLDELARERMNLELLRIWKETGTTVIFVTHSIDEAVFLSDKVYVLGKKPTCIIEEIEIPLARPRSMDMLDDMDYLSLVGRIRRILRDTLSPQNGDYLL
jgi:NitT/TauT family transport system ATP-binding protein